MKPVYHHVSKLFPSHVRVALINAAKADPGAPKGDSKRRAIAVDAAIGYARRECPQLFNHTKE